ncbi:hypothetical protein F2P81_009001 [Scophthalmus maximus]|uniref:Uncharacterized protein n=1 Tax=Scophthalmus maximus TaxID=52904 RepID=A0A6A4SY35_SCOMX|nr:hypothetical protein F2P81_009001 [Scophthalmus maximus]
MTVDDFSYGALHYSDVYTHASSYHMWSAVNVRNVQSSGKQNEFSALALGICHISSEKRKLIRSFAAVHRIQLTSTSRPDSPAVRRRSLLLPVFRKLEMHRTQDVYENTNHVLNDSLGYSKLQRVSVNLCYCQDKHLPKAYRDEKVRGPLGTLFADLKDVCAIRQLKAIHVWPCDAFLEISCKQRSSRVIYVLFVGRIKSITHVISYWRGPCTQRLTLTHDPSKCPDHHVDMKY